MRLYWFHYVVVLLLLVVGGSSVVEASTRATKSSVASLDLDLSYHPHLHAKTLATAIQSNLPHGDNDNDNEISIDLSSSSIGDDGIQPILDAIFAGNNNDDENDYSNDAKSAQQFVSLFRARTNQLSPRGVTAILQTLLKQQQQQQKKKSNTTATTTTNSQKSDDSNSTESAGDEQQQQQDEHTSSQRRPLISSLDLSWNLLAPDVAGSKTFHRTLQSVLSDPDIAPTCLSLDCCGLGPAACRAMAKGIVNSYTTANSAMTSQNKNENDVNSSSSSGTSRRHRPPPLSLSLCGNPSVGDAGAAALAAAIRTAATLPNNNKNHDDDTKDWMPIFYELDLSSCDIGDAGAEALALALEDAPAGCCVVRHLDLSNNRLSNQGSMAIGRALQAQQHSSSNKNSRRPCDPKVASLDLSNNKDISDRGVSALATALEGGHLQSLSLRSCHVYADGAALFGKALRSLAGVSSKMDTDADGNDDTVMMITLDLSGNPLGILRGGKGRSDNKMGGGGAYSASRLKSKASATAASYMGLLRKGLKDVGVDSMLGGSSSSSSLESDDEEDEKDALSTGEEDEDPSKSPCGIKALADAFLGGMGESDDEEKRKIASLPKSSRKMCLRLGLRRCFLDHGAADALAALIVDATDTYGITDVSLDVRMNPVLEDEMVDALQNEDGDDKKKKNDEYLREMAERHNDIREALWEAQQRAAEARAAAARAREIEAQQRRDEMRQPFFDFDEEEDDNYNNGDGYHVEIDSDADYENEEDDYY